LFRLLGDFFQNARIGEQRVFFLSPRWGLGSFFV
jgi:hypothetical protein